jgi:hypothetical protein
MAVPTIAAPAGTDELVGQVSGADDPPRSPAELSRRRFTKAVVIGIVVMLPPFLYLLWDMWSGVPNPLRGVPYDNFYDLQARAMFHGHLNLPSGQMGIEAFKHDGRSYTYFGIFPSLIRMPILLVTSSFDGDLTGASILVAWLATGLFTSLMLWRLRVLMWGSALVGRFEATCYGVFMATVMGGSVLIFLAATPFIYNEDFAWSVPLTVGSLFAMIGVMERPSWGRIWASGVLVLCTSLNRTPAGYGCVIGALLIAGWLALGYGGKENRRWGIPMVAVGVIPFAVSSAVTYGKFGIPVGLPMADQVWAAVNAHRRYFLAANGGKAFSLKFLPSTLTAYFQPTGIRFSGIFPYIAPPGHPAAWEAGAVMDQTYPTASIPATTPLLLILAVWGTVTAFRPKALGQIRFARIILLSAAAGAAGVLLWGYISQRYIADLMPFLIIAAAVGIIDLSRRMAGRTRRAKRSWLAVLGVLAVYCFVANMAIALWPVSDWTLGQAQQFVSTENALSVTPLSSTVQHGSKLPYWAPAGTLFMVGNCSGLYLSTGNAMKYVPGQYIQHLTWLPVTQQADFTHTIGYTFNEPASHLTKPVPILTYGKSTLVIAPSPKKFQFYVEIEHSGTSIPWPPPVSGMIPIYGLGIHQKFTVITDPNLNQINVWWDGKKVLGHYLGGTGPGVVQVTPPSPPGQRPIVSVTELPTPPPDTSLCHSLLGGH